MLENTFSKFTFEYLLASALDKVPSTVDKRQGSLIYDALAPACYEMAKMYMNLQSVLNKWNLENLEGVELENFINQRTGILRRPGVKAMGHITFSGTASTVISLGTRVGSDIVNYTTVETGVISGLGTVDVLVQCEQEGVIGNANIGQINKVVTSLLGVYNVSNNEEFITGYDEESDLSLIGRYYDKLQRPGKAGNAYHYVEWAKSVPGVGDARVYPAWNGPLTVKVVIIDSNKRSAASSLIDDVILSIDSERPFGATVTVISAVEKSINIEAALDILEHYSRDNVIDTIISSISNYLQNAAFKSDFVSYARIGGIIIETPGVIDYSNLRINNGTSNIALTQDEIPVIGVSSII